MNRKIKFTLLILVFISISNNIFSKESMVNIQSDNYIRLNVLSISEELDQILDSVLMYDLNKIDILDEIYFYIFVYEDSLKENMAVEIRTNLKRELNFSKKNDFSGIIKKEDFEFLLLNKNSSLVSCHTNKYIDFTYEKIQNNYYPIDFDGPVWIYTINKNSKVIKLWRLDSSIDFLD